MVVVVVDYGLGNLRSVAGGIERVGGEPRVSSTPADLLKADRLILPGVGAFGDGMRNLRERGLIEPLTEAVVRRRTPILGICLGAQLLARESFEFGRHQGLGWIDGSVVRLDDGGDRLKIPHVGWNDIIRTGESVLFDGIPAEALFYFVHSFHVQCRDPSLVTAWCDYGGRFAAAFQSGNIYATQFHPEKSQRHGLALLKNFLEKA